MEAKMAFQRIFLIFNTEDTGFEAGLKPSGHLRIEVRDQKGKLWSTVQNLASADGRPMYRLYLVKAGAEPGAAVCAGMYGLRQNKAELEWEFDPYNVNGSGYGISDFDVFTVLAEHEGRDNTRIACPLAAYKKKGTDWKKKLEKLITSQSNKPQKPPETQYIPTYPVPAKENIIPQMIPAVYNNFPGAESSNREDNTNQEENVNQEENTNQEGDNIYPEGVQNNFMPPENIPEENSNELPVQFHHQHDIHVPMGTINKQTGEMPVQTEPQYYGQTNEPVPPVQVTQPIVNLDSNCVYMNGNMCGVYVNSGGPSPCEACQIHANARSIQKEEKKGDLDKLKELLNRNFEQSDPFHTKRSDYKWWKVLNPVNLNNILYQCNIRSPLLFNPMVMMAHFKYRHLEIGIFTDRVKKREYVICGVPGMYMLDKKPFGDMCKWVQAEGSRPKYGGFGYWVVYIDPGSGRILSIK